MGPFERHLREAIVLNRERAPRYADLSGGASLPVSRLLIASEVVLLPVAYAFDRWAAPYHAAGVPVLEALFVPMRGVPPFAARLGRPPVKPPPAFAHARTRREAWKAYRAGGFEGSGRVLARGLERLRGVPVAHCMVRHLLESARRLCNIAPPLAARSADRGLPSPESPYRLLLRMHLWGLAGGAYLDRRAHPLQAAGLPILVNDLPPIPPWPDGLRPSD